MPLRAFVHPSASAPGAAIESVLSGARSPVKDIPHYTACVNAPSAELLPQPGKHANDAPCRRL